MKFISIFFLLWSFISSASTPGRVDQICEKGGQIVRDWYIDQGENGVKIGDCLEAQCVSTNQPNETLSRTMCLVPAKDNPMALGIRFRDADDKHSSSYSAISYINNDHPCINSCEQSNEKMMLGLVKKNVKGLERKSCLECLKKNIIAMDREGIYFDELGKKVYKEQRCYNYCEDIRGPFSYIRKASEGCISCLNQKFTYLVNQAGKCWEIDSLGHRNEVPSILCERPDDQLKKTKYKYEPSFMETLREENGKCVEVDIETLGKLYLDLVEVEKCQSIKITLQTKFRFEKGMFDYLMGTQGHCVEYDEETRGQKYKAIVDTSFCEEPGKINNTGREIIPDKVTPVGEPSERSRASHQ